MTAALVVIAYLVVGVCLARNGERYIGRDRAIQIAAMWPVLPLCLALYAVWMGIDWLLFESWRRKRAAEGNNENR